MDVPEHEGVESHAIDFFGKSVATTGEYIFVSATGYDLYGENAGAVFLYQSNTLWLEITTAHHTYVTVFCSNNTKINT